MARKPIHELFPERTRRVRRGRGFVADVRIKSIPTTRDFFEALAYKLVYYKETLVKQDKRFCGGESIHVDALYHEDDFAHQRYGYINYGVCNCSNCDGLGLNSCQTGKDLSIIMNNIQRNIHWYDNQEVFLVNLCHYTTDMQIITPIVGYFYPYEEDKKFALFLQVRLIEQRKEIAQERAAARLIWRPLSNHVDDFLDNGFMRVQQHLESGIVGTAAPTSVIAFPQQVVENPIQPPLDPTFVERMDLLRRTEMQAVYEMNSFEIDVLERRIADMEAIWTNIRPAELTQVDVDVTVQIKENSE